jgi:hypothetical protein
MDPKLKEIVEQHLTYEIGMLFWAYGAVNLEASKPQPEGHIINALIESFCVHARILNDFLLGKKNNVPAKSVTYDYKPFASGKIDKKLTDKIGAQIVHLGRDRTSDPASKIGGADRLLQLRSIAAELVMFRQHLRPEYQVPWSIEISGEAIALKVCQ